MKITFKQTGYNSVTMTLNLEELDTVLDNIGAHQIAEIIVTIKKPAEADNAEEN